MGIGELAALATATLWAGCAQCFGAAGQRIGSVAVNHLRLPAALLLLTLAHLLLLGTVAPSELAPRDVLLFTLSGIVGLVLGDASAFQGLVLVGPGTVTLLYTAVPAVASLLAFAFLGERLDSRAIAGMAVTIGGLLLALGSRTRSLRREGSAISPRVFVTGVLFALGGAVGQAGGVVLAKPALAQSDALSGTWVRMLAATIAIWLFTGLASLVRRRGPEWWAPAWGDRRGLLLTLGGVLTGPTSGVWLSLVATKHADVAIATTLMSLTPLIVMFLEWPLFGRRPRAAELAGAAVAIVGVGLLVGLV